MRIAATGLAAILIGCPWQAAADETPAPEVYTIRQSTPNLGSNIRREIIIAGSIPPDKRYDELTEQQKGILKSIYWELKAGDEPPFPADGLKPIFMVLRRVHEQTGLHYQGPLAMYVLVDGIGRPTEWHVLETPDAAISDAVADALMAQHYKPPVCGGHRCTMKFYFHAELIGPQQDRMTPTLQYAVPRF